MIFPDFKNIKIIDDIRKKYDPLAQLVRPHITIVFPFEDEMDNEELAKILNRRLAGIRTFEIQLKGFSKCVDRFGNYLFLNVLAGEDKIIKIHDLLYDNEFGKHDLGLTYSPHMTVGKVNNVSELELAYDNISEIKTTFVSTVNKISVEMIGDNEESIVIIEKYLAQ